MADPVRVMVEVGKKKRVAASAFDWPGWHRSTKLGQDVLAVLEAYRPRYAPVAALAGIGAEFEATGPIEVVETLEGTGMTDFYGVSGRTAAPEFEPMTDAQTERKLALLQACWTFFDDVAGRVTELRVGPRGGGRDRARLVRHVAGSEILEYAPKVGVQVDPGIVGRADELRAFRDAFVEGIREHSSEGVYARTWTIQFLIRRAAYHVLDHAWEMQDRDVSGAA
jgi:hypothetical protein